MTYRLLNILLLSVLLAVPMSVWAQSEQKALTILDAMSKRYQSLDSYAVKFTYTTGQQARQKGEASVKGQMFRLKMAEQEILSDSKLMATFLKESNEVTLQDYNEDEIGDLSPTRIYLAYKKGYKNSFIGETKANGRTYENIRLTPTRTSSQIANVELKIDKADRSIQGWKIVSKNNEATNFEVTEFQSNPSLPDQNFVFSASKFPGAEVIDLR